jgi:hypothetical protein
MPTNILRKAADQRKPQAKGVRAVAVSRVAVLTAGRASVRIELADTATADLVWRALPLHSSAETWGAAIQFEVPLEAGRDRTAKINGTAGEVYFWVEDDRIVVPFGPTPISRKSECRLQSPANVIGRALDDVTAFSIVTPGEKVSLVAT